MTGLMWRRRRRQPAVTPAERKVWVLGQWRPVPVQDDAAARQALEELTDRAMFSGESAEGAGR